MGQKGGSSPWQIDVLKFGGGFENFHVIDLVGVCSRLHHFGLIFEGKSNSGAHSWAGPIELKI